MFVTCIFLISTLYLEKQIQVVLQLLVRFGWSSLETKNPLAMMRLSWLGMVFWCKEFIQRFCSNQTTIPSVQIYVTLSIMGHPKMLDRTFKNLNY